MSVESKDKIIEIRSEEVSDILGKTPVWILRRGIVLIIIITTVLLTISWFIKYPDIIAAPVIITSQNPPSPLIARTSGKIMAIYVKDRQRVLAGQYLMVLENAAILQNVLQLKSLLSELNSAKPEDFNSISPSSLLINNLGDLQQPYINWTTSLMDYKRFADLDYSGKKVKSIREQILLTYNYLEKLSAQNSIQAENLKLAVKQYQRDSLLFRQKVIPQAALEESDIKFLNVKASYKNSEIALDNISIQLKQLDQQILEILLQEEQDRKRLMSAISTNTQALRNLVQTWELSYTLQSPVPGKVVLGSFWSVNQQVKAGDQVMVIIPDLVSAPLGKITLPIAGAGKVKPGQKVIVKLNNYPYLEYGMIKGVISRLSEVPNKDNYLVEVSLPANLKTNYNKQIHFDQEMTGTAEIITDDMSLLERLFHPIRSVMKRK